MKFFLVNFHGEMELSDGKDTSHQESSDVAFLLSYADFLHVEEFERISFREHSYFLFLATEGSGS